jgi:hypothetical protein
MEVTGIERLALESPKSNRAVSPRYWRYWRQSGLSTPNLALYICVDPGLSPPGRRAAGMKKKFTVAAIKATAIKRAILLRK